MPLAPFMQLTHYRSQVTAGVGQELIVTRRAVTIGSSLHQPDLFELVQSGEDAGAQAPVGPARSWSRPWPGGPGGELSAAPPQKSIHVFRGSRRRT